MVSDIWLRTILIVRKETRCRHIGYSYRLTARVLLYAPSHRQDNTYHGLCYTSRGALVQHERHNEITCLFPNANPTFFKISVTITFINKNQSAHISILELILLRVTLQIEQPFFKPRYYSYTGR